MFGSQSRRFFSRFVLLVGCFTVFVAFQNCSRFESADFGLSGVGSELDFVDDPNTLSPPREEEPVDTPTFQDDLNPKNFVMDSQLSPLQPPSVAPLNFPLQLPAPTALQTANAFNNLSFSRPLFLTHSGDGSNRLFVVEQDGLVRVFPNNADVEDHQVFLNISDRVSRDGNEEGLLGLAFHPSFRQNGYLYVYYSAASPRRSVISRFQVSPSDNNQVPASSETVLLEINQPFGNHNGGMMAFGPDGYLYIATGDGGSSGDPQNNSQNLSNLLGKLLRVDVNRGNPYGIPSDNPFVNQDGARDEIYAYGLRNPWRFSFDRVTGALWLGDVGQNAFEEINIVEKGDNLGWRLFEGNENFNNPQGRSPDQFKRPIHTYPRSVGRSVTGGFVYRGRELPSLIGAYIFGDFVAGRIWALVRSNGVVTSVTEIANVPALASFGEDEQGELYALSFVNGVVKFSEPNNSNRGRIPERLSQTGLFTDLGTLTPAAGVIPYQVRSPLWSDGAKKERFVYIPENQKIDTNQSPWNFPPGTVFVKHFAMDLSDRTEKKLETRVFVLGLDGWNGFTYRWFSDQSDAELLSSAQSETLSVDLGQGPETLTWNYPSRTDCLNCHTQASGRVLGFDPLQLNRVVNFGGGFRHQFDVFNQLDLVSRPLNSSDHPDMPNITESNYSTAQRARSYLSVQCSSCHQPGGPAYMDVYDLRFQTPITDTGLLERVASNERLGTDQGLIIDPSDASESVLWQRMRRRDGLQMPPLGTNRVHESAVQLIEAWIEGDL